MKTKKLILFASGNGSNVENIIKYFQSNSMVRVVLVASNNKNAYVLERIKSYNIESLVFDKYFYANKMLSLLDSYKPDLIILAGFLWKIPNEWIEKYRDKIINIHPSLLPKFGGKGMYGDYVHEAVIKAKVKKTGITIHVIDQNYDKGHILFQSSFSLNSKDTIDSISKKVQLEEKKYYPKIIEEYLFNCK
ncbi:MAG: phosphoribosylglycinamide formyltransferase [Flavobacteriaceae bacterium]|nr:phosphoribosylglycinamide formyltransferase [Flavobacteriaceae bacterium]|tara:strand:- start:8383 stop:8955 length:573 start_codon:yes stop_codon:yes gene_type:complete